MEGQAKKVGVYVRVSTTQQNTTLQKQELITYAKARGWVIEVFEDKATGTNAKRANLKRMMVAARARKIDVVLCWKLDRLFRSLKDLVLTIQELTDLGVAFVSLKDQIDLTTPQGRLMVHLLAAFAEFEASLIKTRVNAGLAAAKKRGVKLGRPRLHKEAEVLKLRKQGYTYQAIQKELGISKGAVYRAIKSQRPKNPPKSMAVNNRNQGGENGK